MIFIATYILIAIAIIAWDAYIGFGFEFQDSEGPIISAIFWPIGLFFILLIVLHNKFGAAKKHRLAEAEAKERIRINALEEQRRFIQEIEEEMFVKNQSVPSDYI